jgi:anti-anti-sigma regulatory factor
MDPTLRIFVDRRPHRPVVAVVGELDVGSAASFDEEVEGLGGSVAAVDARYTTFIDAAGIAALVRLGAEEQMAVVASPPVARLIRICGLEEHLVPISAEPPRAFDQAPFAVLEVDDADSIVYANVATAAHCGLATHALVGQRWSDILAFGGLRRGIADARRSGGPAIASTVAPRCEPHLALCWAVWTLDRASGSRAVVAIGAPA